MLREPGRRPFDVFDSGSCPEALTREEAIRQALAELEARHSGSYQGLIHAAKANPELYIQP